MSIVERIKRIDPSADWVIWRGDESVDYELTIIEGLSDPAKITLTFPPIFERVIWEGIKRLFPEIRPLTKLNTVSLHVPVNEEDSPPLGYFRCSEHIFVNLMRSTDFIVEVFFDKGKVSAEEISTKLKEAIREAAAGVLIDVTSSSYFNDFSLADGKELFDVSIPPEIFFSFYPEDIQAAFRRVFRMIDVISEKKGKGIHFGVLVAGPPGTGKSLFSVIAARHAAERGSLVIFGTGMDQTFQIFSQAIEMFPSVLTVIDECEPLVISREVVTRRETLHLMRILDGYTLSSKSSWGLILTTNRPSGIDPALLRPMRLEEIIELRPIEDPSIGRRLFDYYREVLGVPEIEGIEDNLWVGRTHAEIALLVHKINSQINLGYPVTAETVSKLLKDISKWSKPQKIKSSVDDKVGL